MTKDAAVVEAMLLRWGDNQNGRTVTLLLPADGEHPFRGLKCGPANGQRLALSVALIADDESKTNLGKGVVPTESKYKPSDKSPRPVTAAHAPKTGGAHRSWSDMPPSQQAGLLCIDPAFGKYLSEAYPRTWATSGEDAAECVRCLCGVPSRAALTPENPNWRNMVSEFRAWMYEPAVVPA